MNTKEPWLAVLLSSIYAGVGQIYSGDRNKGISFIVIETTLLLATLTTVIRFMLGASTIKIILGVFLGISAFAFSIYNLFDAYRTAKAKNEECQLRLPPRKKQPFLALFLSSIIPGLGQIYNSQWLKGIGIFIGVMTIGGILESMTALGPLISLVFEIVATLWILNDAYSQAAKMNSEESNIFQKFGQKKVLTVATLWLLLPILLGGSLAVIIRTYFLSPYKIPVDSMAPTLLKGDRIFANKWIYRYGDPKRGDLIVFEYPIDRKKDFIKRIAGLPGEKLKIENGHIYVNEKLLESPQFPKDRIYSNREDWQYGKSGQVVEIPPNSYFVLGDNSTHSSDSRNWGFVTRESVKAKGYWIWWPPERAQKIE